MTVETDGPGERPLPCHRDERGGWLLGLARSNAQEFCARVGWQGEGINLLEDLTRLRCRGLTHFDFHYWTNHGGQADILAGK